MSYLIDFLVGFLGFMVGALVYELAKPWLNRTRQSFADVQRELMKDVKRPKPESDLAEHLEKYAAACELVERARRKRPVVLKPDKRYSVQEILAMARAEKATTTLSEAIKKGRGGEPPTPRQGFA